MGVSRRTAAPVTVVGVGIILLRGRHVRFCAGVGEIDAMERCDSAVWVLHTGNQGRVIGKVVIIMAIR